MLIFLIYVTLVFTIIANNGIMVIPSLPPSWVNKNHTDEKLSIKELGLSTIIQPSCSKIEIALLDSRKSCVKMEELKITCVKMEELKITCVKMEELKITCVKMEKLKITNDVLCYDLILSTTALHIARLNKFFPTMNSSWLTMPLLMLRMHRDASMNHLHGYSLYCTDL